MTKDTALKMAIEALNDSLTRFSTFNEMQHDAIQACIDALEQPAQEPVGWFEPNVIGQATFRFNQLNVYEFMPKIVKHEPIPLYTHPHQWQGLTNDKIREIGDNCLEKNNGLFNWIDFARAIEQELKTKNGFSGLKDKNT